nr:MAG: hypothetical protein [scracolig virus 1]
MASNARYKGARLLKPRTANSYAAIEETFQYTFANPAPTPATVFVVEPGADMNEIKPFEPQFRPNSFINTGNPLCYAMFNRFDEFRIRSVQVRVTSQLLNPVNTPRSDCWIWWCPNHYEEDDDAKVGNTFDNVTDMEEAARIQRVSVSPGKSFMINCVPQLTMIDQSLTAAQTVLDQHGDKPVPWMQTTATNINEHSFRMPVIYFRRPYLVSGQPPISAEQQYQIVLTAIIEFRNLDDDN